MSRAIDTPARAAWPPVIGSDPKICIVETPEDLAAIHRPGCVGAFWQRQPLPAFQHWIDALDTALLPQARLVVRPWAIRDAIDHLCTIANTPSVRQRAMLADDISALAICFAEVLRVPLLRLCLEVITTAEDLVPQGDPVAARLLCSYRGSLTHRFATEDSGQQRTLAALPGMPLLARGPWWPTRQTPSPPSHIAGITEPGEPHLVLRLETVNAKGSATGHPNH